MAREEEEEGEGLGTQSTATETQTHHHTSGRSSRLESGRADGTPDPIALLRVATVSWHLILESLSPRLRSGEVRKEVR